MAQTTVNGVVVDSEPWASIWFGSPRGHAAEGRRVDKKQLKQTISFHSTFTPLRDDPVMKIRKLLNPIVLYPSP
jgi:hypothetical protein